MSDAALSQDEIDALLSGANSFDSGGTATATAEVAPGGSEEVRSALQTYLASTVGSLSSNISMLTGAPATLGEPQVGFYNRDTLVEQLPDTVTVIKANFNSGFPGEHMFILGEDTAKAIASLMNKEENITLDEMAMSVIGEVVSQLVGTQITTLTAKSGNKSIAAGSPEAANVPKAVAALPNGDFPAARYSLELNGNAYTMWEVYGGAVAADIAKSLSGGASPAAPPRSAPAQAPGPIPNIGQPMMMGGQGNMGQLTGVQPVQFPNLTPHITHQEQGNIGLIMDVYMEMTVELGRTRKLIKEILGMGEGTIIELDKLAGEPVDILVNRKLIAKGEVVVIDENFGVRVTEIVSPMERMSDLG
ncbi:flagellar motor switch protein FliN [Spirochaetia bacterium]|nr:flagellar motor switch protein FliN [Spirochaetia bacterium]